MKETWGREDGGGLKVRYSNSAHRHFPPCKVSVIFLTYTYDKRSFQCARRVSFLVLLWSTVCKEKQESRRYSILLWWVRKQGHCGSEIIILGPGEVMFSHRPSAIIDWDLFSAHSYIISHPHQYAHSRSRPRRHTLRTHSLALHSDVLGQALLGLGLGPGLNTGKCHLTLP